MSAVAAAIVGGAVIGGVVAGNASKSAAQTQADAANNATNTQLSMFNTQQANAQPWMTSGSSALSTLNADMPDLTRKMTMADFQQDPGYQFDLQQGQNAMQRSAAAKGMLNSMGTQQNLNNYSMGMASNEYGNAYNRFVGSQTQRYNMLSGLSQQGLQATGLTNAAAANAGNNISNNQIAAGNASAAGQIGTANAITGTIGNATNGLMNYNMMNTLMANPNTSTRLNFMSGVNPNSYGGLNGSQNLTMPQLGSSSIAQSYSLE